MSAPALEGPERHLGRQWRWPAGNRPAWMRLLSRTTDFGSPSGRAGGCGAASDRRCLCRVRAYPGSVVERRQRSRSGARSTMTDPA